MNPHRPVQYPWGVVGRPARANRNTSEPTRLRCRFRRVRAGANQAAHKRSSTHAACHSYAQSRTAPRESCTFAASSAQTHNIVAQTRTNPTVCCTRGCVSEGGTTPYWPVSSQRHRKTRAFPSRFLTSGESFCGKVWRGPGRGTAALSPPRVVALGGGPCTRWA